MADGGGGERRWQDEVEPDLRPRVRQCILQKFSEICNVRDAPSQKLQTLATNFEEGVFRTAKCRVDYMRNISSKMASLDQKRSQVLQAAADRQQQQHMQMVGQMQTIQGGNSSGTATSQAVSMTASPIRTPSQFRNQHVACSSPNMQIKAKQGSPDMMSMLDHTFNSQHPTVAPVALGVHPIEQTTQSVAIQSQSQCPSMQLQHTNVAQCQPAELQGQPVVIPNEEHNHLFRQNASGICEQPWQPADSMMTSQQDLNQLQILTQRHQMLGDNVTSMNISYPGGWNNMQNAGWTAAPQSPLRVCGKEVLKKQTSMESPPMGPAQQKITINQQSNAHCPSPQISVTMGSAEEVDWREEIFQQQKIESWKDNYFSDLIELNRTVGAPKLTEEQLQSLPKDKAEAYNRRSSITSTISSVLNFLQLQKSEIRETMRGLLPKYQNAIHQLLGLHGKIKAHNEGTNARLQKQNCHGQPQTISLTGGTPPFTGRKSNQQKLPLQTMDGSISQISQTVLATTPMRQNVVTTTPPARQKTHSNQSHIVTSPCIAINSPGALLSSPSNDVEVCCRPSPIAKSGVAQVPSPYASPISALQSATDKQGMIAAASSPCASVKSTLTPNIKNSGVLAAVSPCTSVKSTLPLNVTKNSGVASLCDSVKSLPSKDGDSISPLLAHCNAPEAEVHKVTPTKLMTPASPGQAQTAFAEAEDRAETLVAKKPIDRLLDAVRSLSVTVLRSSVSSLESALSAMDTVPLLPWSRSNNKMKRAFDLTTSRSESSALGSMDGSSVTFEGDASDSASSGERSAKRQKTQNAKDALLDEILAINGTLIDTMISIVGDNETDAITSCYGGTVIKLSCSAVALTPSLKSHFATSEMQPLVMPVKLLVPADYPRSSPVLVDNGGCDQLRTKFNYDLGTVDVSFRRALCSLPEPRSMEETARAWDACVRTAVIEYACQHGGGTMSSWLGRWESCVGA
ncbi:hypothetical protein ACP70R_012024 [Stipagrostis hirtigluma subsp. patula]